jgi:choline dehydrogenase-like flavoprotein
VEDGNGVVIIGSGPAGAAAAVFLAEAGVKVLLLEAGAERSERGLTVRLHGMTVAKRRRALKQRVDVTRTAATAAQLNEELAPGGLSNHWSCAVPRFSEEDFKDAARAGVQYTWPVNYADLAPFYDRVEPLLHIAGPGTSVLHLPAGKARDTRELGEDWHAMVSAAEASGRSIVPMPYAYGAESTVTFSGTVFNAFVRLVKPLLASGAASIRYNARAVRLDWSPQSRRVEGVVVRDPRTGLESRVPCRAVVVAAGAINSAEILLASKSPDFPDGLGNTHGVLGRYLHDHPLGKLVVDLGSPVSIHPATYVTRLALERSSALYAAAGMQWSGAAIYARSMLAGKPGRLPWIGYSVFGTMTPERENFVALASSSSSGSAGAGVELHVSHPPEALRMLDETRDQIIELLAAAGLKPRTRIWQHEPVGNSNHYGGTVRMHASPEFGMLDAFSRMHAVPNVVVADSAAFTTGPEKNPVLTAMALAARGSDKLAQELKTGDL